MNIQARRYWIGVASYENVKLSMRDSFAQVCHGKAGPLKRMRPNDVIIYYSPSHVLGKRDGFQSFTAIGKVVDYEIYQVQLADDFAPFRRNVEFYQTIQPAKIHPLIPELTFIEDKTHYGYPFRFGHFEITKDDAMKIWEYMKI